MRNKVIKTIFMSLILCASMCMIAIAGEWKFNGENWKYYDKDGVEATCAWQKSGDNWYYLDVDGNLATDTLVDNEDGTYSFVDELGAKVFNCWICRTDDTRDLNENWLYIKSNGKTVKEGWQTIGDKKYCFADNKMLTGFIKDGMVVDSYEECENYCGPDGAKVTGWQEIALEDGTNIWLYFKGGKKVIGTMLTINGHKYIFDENGKMLSGIVVATESYFCNNDATREGYPEGALVKSAWTETSEENGDKYWIYSKADGTLVKDGQYKVNGRYYYFTNTKMQTGWRDGKYYREDGDMATGRTMIKNATGDNEMYDFKKDGTPAEDGDNGKAYEANGKLVVPADDHKFVVYNHKLVNKSGAYCKAGTYKDTNYDKTYVVNAEGYVE